MSDTHPRYIVVTQVGPEPDLAVTYLVVDTKVDSNGEGEVWCEGTAQHAHQIVEGLNLLGEIHPAQKGTDR